MKITETFIKGVYVLELDLFQDKRGYFTRVFGKDELKKAGIEYDIVSINRSRSQRVGTIRGLHRQLAPHAEDKIVQCLRGAIFDVALDVREGSKTFGKWFGIELTPENMKMLLIPKGMAHGFQVLKPNSVVEYFVSAYYAPDAEAGIMWNDPKFDIDWPITENVFTSSKDAQWPPFEK